MPITRTELKHLSKNELIRLVLEQQQPPSSQIATPWPAVPVGQETVIVSRTEWRGLLEEVGREYQGVLTWLHQVERAVSEIEAILTGIFTAVAAGGRGRPLAKAIWGNDEHLLSIFARLVALVEHPPVEGEIHLGELGNHIHMLGRRIAVTRPAIADCTAGLYESDTEYRGDGGAALRQLALDWGPGHIQALVRAIVDDLARIGRPPVPGRDYLVATAACVAAQHYPQRRINWGDVETKTLTTLKAEDTPEAQDAINYWQNITTLKSGAQASDQFRRKKLYNLVHETQRSLQLPEKYF